jgi:uncharacterized protein (DUF1697 family)
MITSGNVPFDTEAESVRAHEAAMERALSEQRGFTTTAIIRSRKQRHELVQQHFPSPSLVNDHSLFRKYAGPGGERIPLGKTRCKEEGTPGRS